MLSFVSRIKSALWISLVIMMLMDTSLLVAQEQIAVCFPTIADSWGKSPEQVAAKESQDFKNTLNSPDLSVYTQPIKLFGNQGEGTYYFSQKGLISGLFTFQAPRKSQPSELFRRLESALNCVFKTSGRRLEVSKNGVEVFQVFWEDTHTFAYLSYFSTQPELTVKMMNKEDADNQFEIVFFKKWLRKNTVPLSKDG